MITDFTDFCLHVYVLVDDLTKALAPHLRRRQLLWVINGLRWLLLAKLDLLFAAMHEAGDVLGTFVGHDHVNDFTGLLHGIRLCYGRGSGYNTYGREGFARGARLIRLTAGVRDFETWLRLAGPSSPLSRVTSRRSSARSASSERPRLKRSRFRPHRPVPAFDASPQSLRPALPAPPIPRPHALDPGAGFLCVLNAHLTAGGYK